MPNATAYTGGAATPPRLRAKVSHSGLHGAEWKTVRHASLDSTNLEARRLLSRGVTGKRIVLADTQTNGQCRHDRLWESKHDKGLWSSFIVPVSLPFDLLPQSTLVLAVAVREAIFAATGVSLETKWPNDLLGDGQKCCGLLVETCEVPHQPYPAHLILGVGVNYAHCAADFPSYLHGVATSLHMLANGRVFCREEILRAVAASIEHWFRIWETEGFSPVRGKWLSGNCTLGKRIALPDGYGYSHATAHDLDDTGALVALADDGTALLIDSGEIRFTNAT